MKKRHFVFLAFVIAVSLNSCIPEFGGFDAEEGWDPVFAIPILNDEVTIEDIISSDESNEIFSFDDNQVLAFSYRSRLSTLSGKEFIQIPSLPIPILMEEQEAPADFPESFSLSLARLHSAVARYELSNPHLEPVEVRLTFNNLKKDGMPFSWTFSVPAATGPMTPYSQAGAMEIEGYQLDLTGGTVSTRYTATLSNSGTSTTLPPFVLELKDMDFSYLQGYLGPALTPPVSTELAIDFLKNWTQGNIRFVDPQIQFTFVNEFGLPMAITADVLSFETHLNGSRPLNNASLANGFPLDFPSLGEAGQSKTSHLLINNSNSNIVELIAGIPYELNCSLTGRANPGDDSSITNFLTDTAELALGIEINLPVHGSIKGFRASKAVDFSFEGSIARFSQARIKMIAENGFPIKAVMQGYFLDEAGQAFDSLFTEPLAIEPAPVDSKGEAVGRAPSEGSATLDKARFEELQARTRKLEIQAFLETPNGETQPVKILQTNSLGIKLGIQVGL